MRRIRERLRTGARRAPDRPDALRRQPDPAARPSGDDPGSHAMAHGLEARSPFMDHKVAEFAARAADPAEGALAHAALRQQRLCERYLPKEVLARKKQGFSSAAALSAARRVPPALRRASSRSRSSPGTASCGRPGLDRLLAEHAGRQGATTATGSGCWSTRGLVPDAHPRAVASRAGRTDRGDGELGASGSKERLRRTAGDATACRAHGTSRPCAADPRSSAPWARSPACGGPCRSRRTCSA